MADKEHKERIVVLGAGFGGLELCTKLSEVLGNSVQVTLIDKNDSFFFGFAKLDVLFGKSRSDEVCMPYNKILKAGVQFIKDQVTGIDPEKRTVTTETGIFEADILVIALGADYDFTGTPGLIAGVNEFYTMAGAVSLNEQLKSFPGGHVIIGVCGSPYKCTPAPSEAALMLHDYLTEQGIRAASKISYVSPLPSPVPPSPDTSKALLEAFAGRDISFIPNQNISSLDTERKTVVFAGGNEIEYGLFLGVPKHKAPEVILNSGLAENGWISVKPGTLETKYPGIYALGDVANVGTPKAGVFAEGAAQTVAESIIAKLQNKSQPEPYKGIGFCYIEFGEGKVGRVLVDSFSGPKPSGVLQGPSTELKAEKIVFGASRKARWFGIRQ